MTITASAVLALSISVDAAQFAAQFTPIPILVPVFQVIKNIIQVCEKVESNRYSDAVCTYDIPDMSQSRSSPATGTVPIPYTGHE